MKKANIAASAYWLRHSYAQYLLKSNYSHLEKTIYIEKTKFGKDRLIPIPKIMATDIDNYLGVRSALIKPDKCQYLLINRNQKKLYNQWIHKVFHQAVKQMGIFKPKITIANTTFGAPTPHSLRHGFAIYTLKNIKN